MIFKKNTLIPESKKSLKKAFATYLRQEKELSETTIKNYLVDLDRFIGWLNDQNNTNLQQFNNSTARLDELNARQVKQFNDEELALLKHFYQLPEVLITSAENFGPHHLCRYLFDLAQKFNLFYQKHRILEPQKNTKTERQKSRELRLFLTRVTANILETGLNILGIEVLEKM